MKAVAVAALTTLALAACRSATRPESEAVGRASSVSTHTHGSEGRYEFVNAFFAELEREMPSDLVLRIVIRPALESLGGSPQLVCALHRVGFLAVSSNWPRGGPPFRTFRLDAHEATALVRDATDAVRALGDGGLDTEFAPMEVIEVRSEDKVVATFSSHMFLTEEERVSWRNAEDYSRRWDQLVARASEVVLRDETN
jgi:hypothetical protein